MDALQLLKDLTSGSISKEEAYKRGYDNGLTGKATDYNCHFKIFSSPENTKQWELGKKEGEESKNKKQ